MDTSIEQYINNIQSQLKKGTLEFLVLLTISKGDEVYAADILKALNKTNMNIVEGTLYPLLSRLKREEIVQYVWKESKSGPPRKYYSLTEKGKQILSALTHQWNTFSLSITNLTA